MRKYITSEHNQFAHALMRHAIRDWGEAFRLAIKLDGKLTIDDVYEQGSIFTYRWSEQSARNLAGHFWGLHKGYFEIEDKGRSIASLNLARKIYEVLDMKLVPPPGFILLTTKGCGESLRHEAIDYFVASKHHELTPRSKELISMGAKNYKSHVRLPNWEFK